MGTKLLEINDICKRFDGADVNAVDHVSLAVEEGDFVTILGTSGSGKTTLLKLINRIHEATSGDILYKGQSIYSLNGEDYRKQIGYVIQQGGLFPHWTVAENISTVPKLLKWDKEAIKDRVDEVLKLVRLEPEKYADRYPAKLSGGEQQRVGIARAMAAKPELMLMDEPFGALDAITRKGLQEGLLRLQKQIKTTIVFVTHDVSEALMLGNKIIVMDGGRLQQYDTPYRIIMHPANDFVEKLIKTAGNFYDKMAVITAGDYLRDIQSLDNRHSEQADFDIESTEDEAINTIYSMLIGGNSPACGIRNNGGEITGAITRDEVIELASELA